MKASELRIGNYVMRYSNIMEVSGVHNKDADLILIQPNTMVGWRMLYSDIFGIPLTEDWLLKFGFEKCTCGGFMLNKIPTKFHLDQDFMHRSSYVKIAFVHQLQNLYFALTGEELNIS